MPSRVRDIAEAAPPAALLVADPQPPRGSVPRDGARRWTAGSGCSRGGGRTTANPSQKHWTEFDRMVRRLGALRLERDGLLGSRGPISCRRVVDTFGDAVAAVCRFAGAANQPEGVSPDEAWEALGRVSDAARIARAAPVAPGGQEPAER